jgi:hypothetical protein
MTATATTAATATTTRRGPLSARRRVWVQNVAVQAEVLEVRLHALRVRGPLTDNQIQVADGVATMIEKARAAAFRDNPIPSRWAIWWRGTLIEAAYQNLHAAEALIASLLNAEEVQAEIPEAVARVGASLHRDDPRRSRAWDLLPGAKKVGPDELNVMREQLRKTIEVGYAVADQQHSRLRSFRNLVLSATLSLVVFVGAFVFVVHKNPSWVPLCFANGGHPDICPSGANASSGNDILIIALLGVLGGSFAAALSVSKMQGTSTPYNVPTALALLKVPFGAMTAIGSIILIRGGFVPGLTNLDSQVQILAYAFLFGYAQQLFTQIIDKQGQSILGSLPSKDSASPRPEIVPT